MDAARLDAAVRALDPLVNWERKDRSHGMERHLEGVRDVLRRLGDPQRAWRAVHVAGTKGKGSVSSLVAAALARGGLRSGCYASPHVERVNERVRVLGRDASDALLAEGLERALAARGAALAEGTPGRDATWFDLVTAAAYWIFAREGCDWVAVECGLGGRLDSTNVIGAEVCVVTNVELEHTAVLGATRALIAAEKGAILSPGGVLVTGVASRPELGPDEDALAVLERIARERGGRLRRVEPRGTMEERNRALAAAVLDELGARGLRGPAGLAGAHWLDEATARAARLPARMERFESDGIPVLLDGAHVAASVTDVLDEARVLLGRSDAPQVVLALGKDKDSAAILKALRGRVDRVHATTCSTGPLSPAVELADKARALGHRASPHEAPAEALDTALAAARGGGWVLVLGSFYLAGALRPSLARAPRSAPC